MYVKHATSLTFVIILGRWEGYPRRNWLNAGAVFSDGSHMGTPVSHAAPILGWRVTPSADAKHRLFLRASTTPRAPHRERPAARLRRSARLTREC